VAAFAQASVIAGGVAGRRTSKLLVAVGWSSSPHAAIRPTRKAARSAKLHTLVFI